MAEKKEEATAPVSKTELKRYVATENCFFEGRYLKRGEIITLSEKPDHVCLVEYSDRPASDDAEIFYDPIHTVLEEKRINAAMPGFLR